MLRLFRSANRFGLRRVSSQLPRFNRHQQQQQQHKSRTWAPLSLLLPLAAATGAAIAEEKEKEKEQTKQKSISGLTARKAFDLKGKVALITGGAVGIGRGIVNVLALCGCDIMIIDVNEVEGKKAEAEARAAGARAIFLKADIRSLEQMEHAVERCVKEFGGLDICVANAGVVRTGSVLNMDVKQWQEILDVNLTGTFLTVRAASRQMVRQGRGGRIVTIASANSVLAGAEAGAYCATKSGVAIATRCWAQDLIGHDITVNCVGPGATDTDLMRAQLPNDAAFQDLLSKLPMNRMAEPEEVGWLTAFYCTPAASYLTGTFMLVDGGLHDHAPELSAELKALREQRKALSGEALLAKLDERAKEAKKSWQEASEKFNLK